MKAKLHTNKINYKKKRVISNTPYGTFLYIYLYKVCDVQYEHIQFIDIVFTCIYIISYQ